MQVTLKLTLRTHSWIPIKLGFATYVTVLWSEAIFANGCLLRHPRPVPGCDFRSDKGAIGATEAYYVPGGGFSAQPSKAYHSVTATWHMLPRTCRAWGQVIGGWQWIYAWGCWTILLVQAGRMHMSDSVHAVPWHLKAAAADIQWRISSSVCAAVLRYMWC